MRNDTRANGYSQQPIRDRIAAARQLEYISVQDFSLLSGMSERTIWRRIKDGTFKYVLQNRRITRIHRARTMKDLEREAQG